MTSTKIELAYNRTARMADAADLAELLFPGNRNQQHAFLVIWTTLKWSREAVPDLGEIVRENGVSRRTYERVRAKLRRLGVIEPVSKFDMRGNGRDGWRLSTRFERSLRQMAARVGDLREASVGSKDKDLLLVRLADARRNPDGILPVERSARFMR
jgi:hypothetical protein